MNDIWDVSEDGKERRHSEETFEGEEKRQEPERRSGEE